MITNLNIDHDIQRGTIKLTADNLVPLSWHINGPQHSMMLELTEDDVRQIIEWFKTAPSLRYLSRTPAPPEEPRNG